MQVASLTFPMPSSGSTNFLFEVWRGIRPTAIAESQDFGKYVITWSSVLCVQGVRAVLIRAGVDQDLIRNVGLGETGIFYATFSASSCAF